MKKKIRTLVVMLLAMLLIVGNVLGVSAAENTVVSVKFDANGDFAAMGDLDMDGKFAATALTMLEKHSLEMKVLNQSILMLMVILA